ncbi:MAG: DUF1501 domain-containing protein [Alphaproteobacteria bacterium]|jgi:uncharacterized protein (DUF1501 family)|nr:DUF1501 domain-containing protein [Alphaproteobacteria bacterium]MDP6515465.1 DUF1501 domain-containing protein [Alphaproteobacteria bacterium]|tara:strand:+ start:762 stop:1988 length:1227 start_codon:yes stop_codon:yes gene_type:complete
MTAKILTPDIRLSRRAVLKGGAYGLGLPLAFSPAAKALAAAADPDRILVVVELDGGNDGLNTIVPYGDDAYYRQRPKIGIPAEDLRKLDNHFGFHPALAGFERLYKDGKFAIVHGCGYDNPILSHFAAMGFWHTGVPIAGEKLGWVGRIADAMSPTPSENMIVNIGQAQSLAVRSRIHAPLVFDDPNRFMREGRFEQQPWFESLTGDANSANGTLAYLSGLATSALKSADFVRQAWADYATDVSYGLELPLARDLRKVAALIDADMPTRLYYVNYRNNAFDTHVHQVDLHARLLTYTSDAIHGFMTDIDRIGRGKDIAMMVFTEFGRRVPENASGGTDHGTATPMYVIGDAVKGGVYGAPPSLTELDDGNLIHTTDFRRVYATMIGEWLGLDPAVVLKGDFETLGLFA